MDQKQVHEVHVKNNLPGTGDLEMAEGKCTRWRGVRKYFHGEDPTD